MPCRAIACLHAEKMLALSVSNQTSLPPPPPFQTSCTLQPPQPPILSTSLYSGSCSLACSLAHRSGAVYTPATFHPFSPSPYLCTASIHTRTGPCHTPPPLSRPVRQQQPLVPVCSPTPDSHSHPSKMSHRIYVQTCKRTHRASKCRKNCKNKKNKILVYLRRILVVYRLYV